MTLKRYSKGNESSHENPADIRKHASNVATFVAGNTLFGITFSAAAAGAIAAVLSFSIIFFGIVYLLFAAI